MFRIGGFLLFSLGLAAQPPGLWPRIRARQAENLTKLPNYTCLQTLERSRRALRDKRFQLTDKARLEVALVNSNELFAWPGSKNFQDTEIRYLVPGGGVGNGSFALHARSVFLGTSAKLDYQGEVDFEGRPAYRYDYDVPLVRSRFLLRNDREDEAIAAYRGSFWVERDTLDVIRLTVSAYDIDPKLGIASHLDVLDYQKIPAGDHQMLLPRQSELRMGDDAGHEFLTRITFSGCRQYSAESTISFEEKEPTAAEIAANQPLKEPIPPGLSVYVEVTSKLQWPDAAMGDPVEARVIDDVKFQKRVLIPKGSTLKGRLLLMERRASTPPVFAVGFEFDELFTRQGRGPFAARLLEAYIPIGSNRLPGTSRGYDSRGGSPILAQGHPSGQNLFVVYNEPRFSGGLRLVWQTLAEPLRIIPKKPTEK